ncbi:MAG TPA: hypothetical protein DDW67_09130 [Elusimicrobia bacterium]|jgi:hypothetical protein|nr:hypothetical protein [Elusimicrobiota bacterium]
MKRRAAWPLLAAALLLVPAAASAGRAVWVWEPETFAMLEDRRAALEAISFLNSKGIDTVYLYADSYKGRSHLEKKPKLYRALLRRLGKRGIRAYALLGSWHLRTHEYVLPERHPEAVAMLERVLSYNAASKPGERFAGVNIDIEPHMLETWKTDREGLLLNFLDMSRALMDAKRRARADILVGPAIPFWLDRIELEWGGEKKPVSEHVLDIYDTAALMNYRDRAEGRDGMIEHAASELAYAGKLGKLLAIGVEVTPNEVAKVTFDELSEEYMEGELAKAEAVFSASPAFDGFVIHHYESYRDWLRARGGKEKERK